MKAPEKFRKVFGSISHLKDEISWTTGLSNMVEFVTWSPQSILGIKKKQFVNQIIDWALHDDMQGKELIEIQNEIGNKLNHIMSETEQLDRYAKQTTGICNAREALRRLKYFSEDYVNKEFDIFLNLCSDNYLNKFYEQYTPVIADSCWSTHGNSGVFAYSTELKAMQMDNLAYNHQANLLVANELKLNGSKNADQILKYCLMYEALVDKGFINKDAKYVLLFIGGSSLKHDKQTLIEHELAYCRRKPEKYQHLLRSELLDVVNHIEIASMTWAEFIEFNDNYLRDNMVCQVEEKLIKGFNQSLQSKSFMHA